MKTFRFRPNASPVADQECSPSDRNAVRDHNGSLFGFIPELAITLRPISHARSAQVRATRRGTNLAENWNGGNTSEQSCRTAAIALLG